MNNRTNLIKLYFQQTFQLFLNLTVRHCLQSSTVRKSTIQNLGPESNFFFVKHTTNLSIFTLNIMCCGHIFRSRQVQCMNKTVRLGKGYVLYIVLNLKKRFNFNAKMVWYVSFVLQCRLCGSKS
jgi:hypothetical protein